MDVDRDLAVALHLQEKFNSEASSVDESHKRVSENLAKHTQSSLVDTTWEYIDPTPDVYSMFQAFNSRFFWGKLSGVEVKWSSRMTTCAGLCCYEGRGGLCSVRLSAPLLKLRPRKDLVETLLHEMIHAYLFVTHNNRDRDGHGPEFHKHMNRINKEAGTKISVYHSFHEEVRFYLQHWWRCNGPCQSRPPFFGTVRRASNRAPGPNDFWWDNHLATCGGTFIKIKEPEGFKSKDITTRKEGTTDKSHNAGDIRSFFPNKGSGATSGDKNRNTSEKSSITGVRNNVIGFKDLDRKQGSAANNKLSSGGGGTERKGKKVGGLGGVVSNRGGNTLVVTTKDKKPNVPVNPSSLKNSFVPFNGEGHILGSGGSEVSNKCSTGTKSSAAGSSSKASSTNKRSSVLKTDVVSPPKKKKENKSDVSNLKSSVTSPKLPVKTTRVPDSKEPPCDVIEILDSPEKNSNVQCPVCSEVLDMAEINSHLDGCVVSDISEGSSIVHCPVCNQELKEAELNQHLETCVTCAFDGEEEDSDVASVPGCSNGSGSPGDVGGGGTETKLYPCPCCMTWVAPELMNQHLDECLSSKLLSKYSNTDNS